MKVALLFWSKVLYLCLLILAWGLSENPAINLKNAFRLPSSEFFLGTTPLGQSVAELIVAGAASTVLLAAGALLFSLIAALAVAGFLYVLPQSIKTVYSAIIDAWLAIPGIFIALSIGYFLPQSHFSVMTALILSEFAPLQKFLLQRLSDIARNDYTIMATVMGAHAAHRLRIHILPRLVRESGYLFVVTLPAITLSLASLEFLGVQTGSERMSLGMQIAIYKDYIWLYPHLSLAPVAMLLLTLFCLNGLGRFRRE